MRLLFFSAVYHPFAGGYAESIHELAKRLVKKGCTVTVLTCNTHRCAEQEIIDGIEIKRIPCINPKWLNSTFPIPLPLPQTFRILKLALSHKPDLISTQTRFFPTTWLGFLIGKIKKIPIAHTERGATHSIISSRLISWMSAMIDHTLGWIIVRFSNIVIGVSDASCQFLKHLGAKNLIKIYNGVDSKFGGGNESMINSKNSQTLRNEKIIITFVGRLIFAKGVQDIIHATARLINILPTNQLNNLTVNIIGDGSYRLALEELTEQLNLKHKIRFLGELTRERIREILWQTDIFVNPSHSEGLPRSVLEAAAVGLPIIATDIGGTREILPTKDHGLLVPVQNHTRLTDALVLLINDKSLRERLGANAQRYVRENFDWNKITNQYLELFRSFHASYNS